MKMILKIWHRTIGFVRRTAFNHLAHSSALFPIFLIGFGSIFSLLMRIFVYNFWENLIKTSRKSETESLIGKKRSHSSFNESGTEEEEEFYKRSKTVENIKNPIVVKDDLFEQKSRSRKGSLTEKSLKTFSDNNNEEIIKQTSRTIESTQNEI